jgi:hypothetical protein
VQEARTCAASVFILIGLYLLLTVDPDRMQASRTYAVAVLALVTTLGVGYLLVLSSGAMREFFALDRPDILDVLVIALASGGGMWLLARAGLSPYGSRAAPPRPKERTLL